MGTPTPVATYPAKLLQHVIGGLFTLDRDWKPGLGEPLIGALAASGTDDRLDLGCVAANGIFSSDDEGCSTLTPVGKPATAFLLELIARLQEKATVPMIDGRAYARWLDVDLPGYSEGCCRDTIITQAAPADGA